MATVTIKPKNVEAILELRFKTLYERLADVEDVLRKELLKQYGRESDKHKPE